MFSHNYHCSYFYKILIIPKKLSTIKCSIKPMILSIYFTIPVRFYCCTLWKIPNAQNIGFLPWRRYFRCIANISEMPYDNDAGHLKHILTAQNIGYFCTVPIHDFWTLFIFIWLETYFSFMWIPLVARHE